MGVPFNRSAALYIDAKRTALFTIIGWESMISTTEIHVRGYHLDVYGHVNNARYLEFLEEARWELLENNFDLVAWQKKGLAFFVVNITINFRRPAAMGQLLEIRSFLESFGTKSATLSQNIYLKEKNALVADAKITFVIADSQTGRAVPLEGELRAVFEQFLA